MIVHLYEELGPQCVEKLRGMFAFALWNENTKELFLARDRVGIKPLYYALNHRGIVFASEIKAILADPAIRRNLAPEVVDRFLTFLYVPGEETMLRGISKLAPGHYLVAKNGKTEITQYWDLGFRKPAESLSIDEVERELAEFVGGSGRTAYDRGRAGGHSVKRRRGFDCGTELYRGANGQANQHLHGGLFDAGFADERPYAVWLPRRLVAGAMR